MNEHRITLNQLIRISEDATWEDFEAMSDGRLVLIDRAQTLITDEEPVSQLMWVFEMRIGTHFERPMQAIMCAGHFIRMRSTPVYENCTLGKLDPKHPGACLYQYPVSPYQQAQLTSTDFSWRPIPPQYVAAGQSSLQGSSLQGLTQSSGGAGGCWPAANTPVQQGHLTGLARALGVKI